MTQVLLAKIHIGKKELKLDDATYQALLQRIIGTDSCAGQSKEALQNVVDEMRRLGWKPKAAHGTTPNVSADKRKLLGKIGAILADQKLHWNYAHGTAKKMFKRERVEWLTAAEMRKLVAALSKHQQRQQKKATKEPE